MLQENISSYSNGISGPIKEKGESMIDHADFLVELLEDTREMTSKCAQLSGRSWWPFRKMLMEYIMLMGTFS